MMRRSETIVLMILTAMLASVAAGALLIGPAGAVLAVLTFVGVAHVAGPRLPSQPSADQRANGVLRAQWRESRGDVDVLALCALMGWLVILAALWFVGHDAVASACMIAPLAARPKRFFPIGNHHHTEHTMTIAPLIHITRTAVTDETAVRITGTLWLLADGGGRFDLYAVDETNTVDDITLGERIEQGVTLDWALTRIGHIITIDDAMRAEIRAAFA
jgi:hypothetical protein